MVADNVDDVQDVSLWAHGQALAAAHAPDPQRPGQCASGCDAGYPCLPRRLAHRARLASNQGWPQRWTARLDMHSCGIPACLLPGVR